MSPPQYDPIGLEAAVEALDEAREGEKVVAGRGLSDSEIVAVVLTAYHEAIEPRSWEAERVLGGWLSYHASRLWVEKHARRNPGSFTGRIRALYPGPTEEVRSDG